MSEFTSINSGSPIQKFDQLEKYDNFGIKLGNSWVLIGKLIGFRVDKEIKATKYQNYQEVKKKAIVKIIHIKAPENSLMNFLIFRDNIEKYYPGKLIYIDNMVKRRSDIIQMFYLSEFQFKQAEKEMMVDNL